MTAQLTLLRVQPEETARRGRVLARFLSDLAQRKPKPIPIVLRCPAECGRYYTVSVDLDLPGAPIILNLPDNCLRCGAMLDTPSTIRDIVGTARNLAEAIHAGTLGGIA